MEHLAGSIMREEATHEVARVLAHDDVGRQALAEEVHDASRRVAGVEMALKSFGVEIPVGAGLAAAENYLLETASDG